MILCTWARMTRAKPHWEYVRMLLDFYTAGTLDLLRVAGSLDMRQETVTRLVALPPKVLKRQAALIAKVLQCRRQCGRMKPPRLLAAEQEELLACLALRQAFPVHPLSSQMQTEPSAGEQEEAHAQVHGHCTMATGDDIVVSLPDLTQVEEAEEQQRRREAYAHGKKEPQIAWFLQRLRSLMRFTRASIHTLRDADVSPWYSTGDVDCRDADGISDELGSGWVALDIGGGRGDLAINLVRSVPNLRVHMIDAHAPSLEAAKASASLHGHSVASRMTFAVQDVTNFFSSSSLLSDSEDKSKMVLLGLHVCGGLTDAILALARRHRVAFLCCPCCFLKNAHLRHLAHTCQLAHTSQGIPGAVDAWSSSERSSSCAPAAFCTSPSLAAVKVADAGQGQGKGHSALGGHRALGGTGCKWCGKLHGGRCHKRPKTPPRTVAQAEKLFEYNFSEASGAAAVGPWPAHEWEERWNRLARLGELTPHHGPSFARSVAAHRTAMHSLGVCVRARTHQGTARLLLGLETRLACPKDALVRSLQGMPTAYSIAWKPNLNPHSQPGAARLSLFDPSAWRLQILSFPESYSVTPSL